MLKGKQLALMALAASAFLGSCKKTHEQDIIAQDEVDYDTPLRTLLEEMGGADGLNYFVLPESDDYASIPQDPLNPITSYKVELGKLLFHETGIATNPKLEIEGFGTYSCASCHHAQGGFQANRQQGVGEGGIGFGAAGEGRTIHPAYDLDSLDVQPIRTPTAMNGAYQKVMLWNGQFGATGPNLDTEDLWPPGTPIWNNHFGHEGLETQAIAGLTVHRLVVDEGLCESVELYHDLFDIAFQEFPVENRYTERTAGLAVAAYERTVLSNQAPFQEWLRGDNTAMSDAQKRGAEIFFGKADCASCHNGPALNDMNFYALGMPDLVGPGVYAGTGAEGAAQGRGGFTGEDEDMYKFKTPQLYNLKDSPFFGHGGTFRSVREVVEYKNNAESTNATVPTSQLAEQFVPLNLSDDEISDLVDFIENALYDPNLMRYVPDALPTGQCFPNNDAVSQIDQGCVQ